GAPAVHATRDVPGRARTDGAALGRSRANRALAPRAGDLADVAGTPGPPGDGAADARRAQDGRAIRARGNAGAGRRPRDLRRSDERNAGDGRDALAHLAR